MLRITLPWLDTILTPNVMDGLQVHGGRGAKFAISTARKNLFEGSYYTALSIILELPVLDFTCDHAVSVVHHRPIGQSGRGLDNDAVARAMKPALDGIAKAIGVNDYFFNPLEYRRGEPVEGGNVEVLIDDFPF